MISQRDKAGLTWIHRWALMQLYSFRRRRKYGCPRGSGFTPEELRLGHGLTKLRDGARAVLSCLGENEPRPISVIFEEEQDRIAFSNGEDGKPAVRKGDFVTPPRAEKKDAPT